MLRFLPFVIWFFVSFALIAIGAGLFLNDRAYVARSLPVVGEVKSVTPSSAASGRRFTASVQWRDVESRAYEYSLTSSSGGTYVEGQRVALRYDPAAPSDVRSDGLPYAAIIVGGIGVAFLAFGIAVVVVGLRRDRARAHAAVL